MYVCVCMCMEGWYESETYSFFSESAVGIGTATV